MKPCPDQLAPVVGLSGVAGCMAAAQVADHWLPGRAAAALAAGAMASTALSATAVAAARLKRANRIVNIALPGGDLAIEWRERDDHVLMTGTATFEYEGRFDPALFASVA